MDSLKRSLAVFSSACLLWVHAPSFMYILMLLFLYDGFPVLRLLGPKARKHLISTGIPRWLGQCTALTIFMRMLIFSYISQQWEEFCKSRSSQRGSTAGECSSNCMWGLCVRSSGSSPAACSCSSSLFIASTKFLRFKLQRVCACMCVEPTEARRGC